MSIDQNVLLHSKFPMKFFRPTLSTSRTLPFGQWETAGIGQEENYEHAGDVNSPSSPPIMNGLERMVLGLLLP